MTNVSLQTDDDFEKVASFYEEKLAQNGYREDGSSDNDARRTLVMKKKGAWVLDVIITKNKSPTNIAIVFPKNL